MHSILQSHSHQVIPVPKGRWYSAAGKITAGLAKSNGSLPPGGWLIVTCGMTACTSGSAPDPTLSNEYGKTLPFTYTWFCVAATKVRKREEENPTGRFLSGTWACHGTASDRVSEDICSGWRWPRRAAKHCKLTLAAPCALAPAPSQSLSSWSALLHPGRTSPTHWRCPSSSCVQSTHTRNSWSTRAEHTNLPRI